MNSWLLSCKWTCPSAGASCVATGRLSSRSDASLMFRSARTRCHRLSFNGTVDSTLTSSGPLPTSKEKTTRVDAWERKKRTEISDRICYLVLQNILLLEEVEHNTKQSDEKSNIWHVSFMSNFKEQSAFCLFKQQTSISVNENWTSGLNLYDSVKRDRWFFPNTAVIKPHSCFHMVPCAGLKWANETNGELRQELQHPV